jgi:phosphate transport system substrate-binding protein
MLFYETPKDKTRAKIMVEFFKWALTDGQRYCAELGYAPLPKETVALEMEALKKIKL